MEGKKENRGEIYQTLWREDSPNLEMTENITEKKMILQYTKLNYLHVKMKRQRTET